jgi:hypothetical protein
VNANGPQDLFAYILSRKGRAEATNYRSVKLPSGVEVPLYVKDNFGVFYQAVFDRAVKNEDMRAVFVEYAWDMGWCDPCAADPLTDKELVELGVRWINSDEDRPYRGSGATKVYVTRLHVRYDAGHFPEDLILMETADRENFQGRYVLRYPWQGSASCPAAVRYREQLPAQFKQAAKNLAALTGWEDKDIEQRMQATGQSVEKNE